MTYARTRIPGWVLGLGILVAVPAHAAQDFTQYQTQDLMQLREQQRYWSHEDKDAYRNEMQTRMQSMTPEERSAMRTEAGVDRGNGSGKGAGNGQGQRLRDGSGGGGGYGGGSGGGRGGGRWQ